MKHQILNLPETARKWSRAVAPVSAHRNSAATGRLRRSDEQQELWGNFVDKHVQENFGEEAAPAARRDVSGPITLFRSTAASRREPTGEMGAAALDRAASEARAAAADRPTWQLERRDFHLFVSFAVPSPHLFPAWAGQRAGARCGVSCACVRLRRRTARK